MKNVMCLFLLSLVIQNLVAQEFSGIWKLKEKKSISGTDYSNGLPTLLQIEVSNNVFTLGFTNSYNGQDTIEMVVITASTPFETVTGTNRKKTVTGMWNEGNKELVKITELSAKNDFAKPEIKIVEAMKLYESGRQLILKKKYDGDDTSNGNSDFTMEGIYEKTTPEEIAFEKAKGQGIDFVKGLNWQQIIKKAKKENKFIFVDCYATWCGPCKKMDKEVFDLNMVGDEMRGKYISVRIQMDTSKNDDKNIKLTYPIARQFEKLYNINVLPTYLFFSPTGEIVHKGMGAFSRKDFITLVNDALNPRLQIFTLIKEANAGRLRYKEISELAIRLNESGEKDLASKVARQCFEQYLYKLNHEEFFKRSNLEFFSKFRSALKSSDEIFGYILKNTGKVDELAGKEGFGAGMVETVIRQEEIQPYWIKADSTGKEPDWEAIKGCITKKFGVANGHRCVINAKVLWYKQKQMWDPFVQNLALQIEMSGDLNKISWLRLNSAAWAVFEHSHDKLLLEKALTWSEAAIQGHIKDSTIENTPWGGILDTYANLLYKLGRKDEAVKFYQERILNNRLQSIRLYENYVKIFRGVPTWPENSN